MKVTIIRGDNVKSKEQKKSISITGSEYHNTKDITLTYSMEQSPS